jgi:hypothetical protein
MSGRADEHGVDVFAVAQRFDARKAVDLIALAGAGQGVSVDVGQGGQTEARVLDDRLDLAFGCTDPSDSDTDSRRNHYISTIV